MYGCILNNRMKKLKKLFALFWVRIAAGRNIDAYTAVIIDFWDVILIIVIIILIIIVTGHPEPQHQPNI